MPENPCVGVMLFAMETYPTIVVDSVKSRPECPAEESPDRGAASTNVAESRPGTAHTAPGQINISIVGPSASIVGSHHSTVVRVNTNLRLEIAFYAYHERRLNGRNIGDYVFVF
jgi:hypothetical protein